MFDSIIEHCNYCRKETGTLEYKGGDCKVCGLSKVTPRTLCSWCGKDEKEVINLIAGGPNFNECRGDNGHLIYICNECVDLCQEVINEGK